MAIASRRILARMLFSGSTQDTRLAWGVLHFVTGATLRQAGRCVCWGGVGGRLGGAADCRADFSCGHVTQVNLHLQKSCEVGGDNSQVAQGW